MPLSAPEPIFQGVTPTGTRRAMKILFEKNGHHFDRFVVPCCGSFAMAEAMLGAGISGDRIETSDISLYTTALGYAIDHRGRMRHEELQFEILDDELNDLLSTYTVNTPSQYAAKILFAVKWGQLHPVKVEWRRWQVVQFKEDCHRILREYENTCDKLAEAFKGASFETKDAFDHIDEVVDDPTVWMWLNFPAYSAGYTKMFDPKGMYSWKEATFNEINLKSAGIKVDEIVDKPAFISLYAEEWYPFESVQDGQWFQYYAEAYGKTKRRIYLWLNKQEITADHHIWRPKIGQLPSHIPPVYDDHEITSESTIELIPTSKEMALYFYDLFVRELGMTVAEMYYLFVVDGQVAGTIGLDIREYVMHRLPILYETFGLTPTSRRYQRINRLLMRTLCSATFARQIESSHINDSLFLPPLQHLQTTCLSKYPEVKTNRGILKLVSKKQEKNGRYHLVYRAKFHDMTKQEVLDEWLEKHSSYSDSNWKEEAPDVASEDNEGS